MSVSNLLLPSASARIGTACLLLSLTGYTATADPVVQLRCLERDWAAAHVDLRENRQVVWDWMDGLINLPESTLCRRLDPTAPDTAGASGDYGFRCTSGAGSVDTLLNFTQVDEERLKKKFGASIVLGAIAGLSNAEFQEQIDDAAQEFAAVIEETLQALGEDGIRALVDAAGEAGIDLSAPAPEVAEPEPAEQLGISALIEPVNPLQTRDGLTATLSWSYDIEADPLPAIADMRRMMSVFAFLDGAPEAPAPEIARAAQSHAKVRRVVDAQAAVWSDLHMPLRANRCTLFGAPRAVVTQEATGSSVIDLDSWSATPQTDWASERAVPMLEAVQELVFYYEPQPAATNAGSPGDDCKRLGTFPCPPLNGGSRGFDRSAGDIPASCRTADGCAFTTQVWVSDHVAVQTHLRAQLTEPAQIMRFSDRLMTLNTKALLNAFEASDDFDPAESCKTMP